MITSYFFAVVLFIGAIILMLDGYTDNAYTLISAAIVITCMAELNKS